MIALLLVACATPPAGEPPKSPAVTAPTKTTEAPFVGKAFRSDSLCFEIHPDGRVVLWDRDPMAPKVAIRGRDARSTVDDEGITWTFMVEEIDRSRWISRCRKQVVGAAKLDAYAIGRRTLKVGERVQVRIEDPAGEPRLCVGEVCVAVRREDLDPTN